MRTGRLRSRLRLCAILEAVGFDAAQGRPAPFFLLIDEKPKGGATS